MEMTKTFSAPFVPGSFSSQSHDRHGGGGTSEGIFGMSPAEGSNLCGTHAPGTGNEGHLGTAIMNQDMMLSIGHNIRSAADNHHSLPFFSQTGCDGLSLPDFNGRAGIHPFRMDMLTSQGKDFRHISSYD